jgi:hypothetical protein
MLLQEWQIIIVSNTIKNEYRVRQNINITVYTQLAFITMHMTSTGIKDMHIIDDIAGPNSTSSIVNLL